VLANASLGTGASWGDDGNIIAALSDSAVLTRIPVGGGAVQPVTQFKSEKEYGHSWPQVLPGAETMLFTVYPTASLAEGTIDAQSLRTGQRKTLVRGFYGRYVSSGHLLYLHQGTLYAAPMDLKRLELTGAAVPIVEEVVDSGEWGFGQVDVSRTGIMVYLPGKADRLALVWLDSTGHTQALRTTPAEYYGAVRFSPDGKRLAVGVVEGGSENFWLYEWERDAMTRLTFEQGLDLDPVWSPDGKHIAFFFNKKSEAWKHILDEDGWGRSGCETHRKQECSTAVVFFAGWQAAHVRREQSSDRLRLMDAPPGGCGKRPSNGRQTPAFPSDAFQRA
jgi:serine/threonine-protein kinase